MKAAVLHGVRDIRFETTPDPELEPDSILIKVKFCGICGSDLHPYKIGGRPGTIFGHEFSGEVAAVGIKVSDIRTGERVIAVGYRPCGRCYWCKQDKPHRCSDLAISGDQLPGALAEYILIPSAQLGRNVFRLPESLSFEQGATVEPMSIALYSVRRAQPSQKSNTAILGAGIIGLSTIQVLKATGVAKVIVSGRRAKRLEVAKQSGADLVINAAEQDIVQIVKEATSGLGVDIVFECAGAPTTFSQAIEIVRGGGKVMLVALYEQPITWEPAPAIYKNITLIGCLGGNFPAVLELMASGKVDTKPFITHVFPLYRVRDAFETQLTAKDAVKVLVEVGQ